ncbi:MAG: RNA pseudouridine synthase [Rhodoferax sp.]
MTDPVRLSKRVAALRGCSRSEAELLIEGGWVRVDGERVELPQVRVGAQQVDIDPQARAEPIPPVTLVLHKPPGFDWDATGRRPAAQLLVPQNHGGPAHRALRILRRHFADQRCVTPLEPAASGLLVFSQEPAVRRRLLEDAAQIEFELNVDVRQKVTEEALERLRRAPVIDGRAMLPVRVSVAGDAGAGSRLRFAVKGCRLGQIAQMCDQAGLQIVAMRRIRVGRVPLAGLAPGRWRYLQAQERI